MQYNKIVNDSKIRKLLFSIFNELIDTPNIVKYMENYFDLEMCHHFGICLTIRNNYLWNNEQNVKVLGDYYNVKDIDALSMCISNDFLKFFYLLKCFYPN